MNEGSHEFFTKVSARHGLCTGKWHRITGEDLPNCILLVTLIRKEVDEKGFILFAQHIFMIVDDKFVWIYFC